MCTVQKSVDWESRVDIAVIWYCIGGRDAANKRLVSAAKVQSIVQSTLEAVTAIHDVSLVY